jgi:hypothetical protein
VLRLLPGRSFADEAQDDKNKGCNAERSEVSSRNMLATKRQRADFAKEAQDDKNKGCHAEPREASSRSMLVDEKRSEPTCQN